MLRKYKAFLNYFAFLRFYLVAINVFLFRKKAFEVSTAHPTELLIQNRPEV